MVNKIGFETKKHTDIADRAEQTAYAQEMGQPKKSLVEIHFPDRHLTLTYFNDLFDLKVGDLVYVDGKLEGRQGRVVAVNYTFKIKMSDYKRVIAVVDTDVKGQFFVAGSHFVSFYPQTLPKEQVKSWFMAPCDDEESAVGNDCQPIYIKDMSGFHISNETADRGHGYYADNRVRYISIDGTRGYAIVEGNKPYEVEFAYHNGEVKNITCTCYCCGHCKHEFAAVLQLKETLEMIMDNYEEEYERYDYFAAILKGAFFRFAIDGKTKGSITL